MSRLFSLRIFSLGFGFAYALAVIYNVPLFRYYPLVGKFSLTDLSGDRADGPGMSWYGWISAGLVGGAVLSVIGTLVVPRRVLDRIPVAVYGLIPIAVLIATWVREREWFLP